MLRRITGILSVLSWSRINFSCFLLCAASGGFNAALGNWKVAALIWSVAAFNLILSAADGIMKAMRTGSGQ